MTRLLPLAIILVFASFVSAISIADYRKNIAAAQTYIDEMLTEIAKSEQGEGNADRLGEISSRLRVRLPAGQKIDVPGAAVEMDADWLIVSLDDLGQRSNLTEKAVVLTGIKERLAAIDQRIGELEDAVAASRSKDEDKQKLAEILRREEYQKPRAEEESLIQRWKREFFEWLERMFPKPDVKPGQVGGFQSFSLILQILLYAFLAAAIGFVIYKFAPFFSKRFAGRKKKKKGDRVILGERIAADASANDLFSEADDLAKRGDFRLAIRKGYIALLCELSDRKLIGLARHKTNRDYLGDVRKRPRLFENMSGMTSTFERHWYGFKNIDAGEWENFRATYERAVSETGQQ